MKVELELVMGSNIYLNFWNYKTGDDVCVEIIDGKLIDMETDKEITLIEFIELVHKRA